jgi:hypothetical protein
VGRPVGSTDGRTPAGGYPEVSPTVGAFLAGFLEGEACFSISRQSRNTNHRCSMTLTARADDRSLLRSLAAATALGSLATQPPRGRSHTQVAWTIGSKADCQRLIELLTAYPLRGRKSLDYAIWSAAATWWIAANPSKRLVGRDWAPIIYLKRRLHTIKRYSAGQGLQVRDAGSDLRADWPDFLSGYFTAEGSLGIYRNGPNRFSPTAQMRVRVDDFPLLEQLQRRTGVGRLYANMALKQNAAPVGIWMVKRTDEIARLAHIFQRHPLRGRKHREFLVWRDAVAVYAESGSPASKYDRLSELRTALARERAYRGAPELT